MQSWKSSVFPGDDDLRISKFLHTNIKNKQRYILPSWRLRTRPLVAIGRASVPIAPWRRSALVPAVSARRVSSKAAVWRSGTPSWGSEIEEER
jgi:hypothetical protein